MNDSQKLMNFGVGFNEGGKKVVLESGPVIDASLPTSGSVQGLRECSISLTFITRCHARESFPTKG